MFIYPAPRGRYQHTNQGYAVIDLETTGFDATGRDRIVEIAIVRVDPSGRELGVFETLIDPQRPVGAGAVHGIDDAMVRGAPPFPEIAASILAWLQGVVVVAHNAPFEDAFLSAEYSRAGWSLPPLP
ncbi:MAG TPA: 3'-5' exonuclease, partial [Actinomycetota bacterium]|nr:3'-5' exonuclease [Actinomycetota bacterium]